MHSFSASAFSDFPMVGQGDDLAELILAAAEQNGYALRSGDIVVIAQKIVSKAQGRTVDLATVIPSASARALAEACDKDPRLVEIILRESTEIVRTAPGLIIAAHRCGVVLANAGVDRSNVAGDDETVLLLPDDPDGTCAALRARFAERLGIDVAVIIADSLGRPWRMGTTGTAIGASGLPALLDLRGKPDLFGRALMVSEEAIADELAAAASLLQGQGAEGRPVVVISGDFPWRGADIPAAALVRPKDQDLFR
ncbi:coenzyme F420-0:L-glutamate ligase [Rhodoligotrophos defluvii]|uniref:coenzyme F420-0:L-glutamate ligase n=1 Tax=Rhodoligotrophos defluvii TaxID=2561934 RepID=UPI0010C985CF|nr:coenzyme F420-0:L-glutamate ligase [Rhodoligotrophos defluvii]